MTHCCLPCCCIASLISIHGSSIIHVTSLRHVGYSYCMRLRYSIAQTPSCPWSLYSSSNFHVGVFRQVDVLTYQSQSQMEPWSSCRICILQQTVAGACAADELQQTELFVCNFIHTASCGACARVWHCMRCAFTRILSPQCTAGTITSCKIAKDWLGVCIYRS